jgi:hypothetical protein
MVVETLVSTVLSVLLPYVAKGGEEFAKEGGKAAFEKAKSLFQTLKANLAGDKEASVALENFEQKPARYQSILDEVLREKLSQDSTLADELEKHLKELGPELVVIQKMKVGEKVTGLEAEEMVRFVLVSRPEPELQYFREKQRDSIKELAGFGDLRSCATVRTGLYAP